MTSTLGNINEDFYFYNFLKNYAFDELSHDQDQQNQKLIANGLIQIDGLFELAVSRISGLPRTNRKGMDLADGSDCKKVTSVFRMNHKARGQWTNSYKISNILNKKVGLRIMGLNRVITNIVNKKIAVHFDFYAVPYSAYENIQSNCLEIVLDRINNVYNDEDIPELKGSNPKTKWELYRMPDFESLALHRF